MIKTISNPLALLAGFFVASLGARHFEVLWMNYDPPERYHDVRFVGSGRRDRERIRRRARNWKNGLQAMPPNERQAVLESLGE